MPYRSAVRSKTRSSRRSPLSGGSSLRLPPGAIFNAKNINGVMTDVIGLSISELYPLVDPALRSIISADGGATKRADEDIVTLALASPLLNLGTMIGTEKGVAFYAYWATTFITLKKAYRYFGLTAPANAHIPLALAFLYQSGVDVDDSIHGDELLFSSAGPNYDEYGVDVGVVPYHIPGRGVYVGPGYANLFANVTPTTESIDLTAQKYCLQVFGTGASCAAGAYGSATESTPLIFTAAAAPQSLVPTSCTKWMLTAAGGYAFPYIPPGTTRASNASAVGGNGYSVEMGDKLLGCFTGQFTAVTLCYMDAGSADLPTAITINNLACQASSTAGALYCLTQSGSGRTVRASDGVNVATVSSAWNRGEIHLRLVETNPDNAAQFRTACQRFTAALEPIDTSPVYSSWAVFDGSFNPETHLRFGYGITVPMHMSSVQVWNEGGIDVDIVRTYALQGVAS